MPKLFKNFEKIILFLRFSLKRKVFKHFARLGISYFSHKKSFYILIKKNSFLNFKSIFFCLKGNNSKIDLFKINLVSFELLSILRRLP